jgi:hypothetical protein
MCNYLPVEGRIQEELATDSLRGDRHCLFLSPVVCNQEQPGDFSRAKNGELFKR